MHGGHIENYSRRAIEMVDVADDDVTGPDENSPASFRGRFAWLESQPSVRSMADLVCVLFCFSEDNNLTVASMLSASIQLEHEVNIDDAAEEPSRRWDPRHDAAPRPSFLSISTKLPCPRFFFNHSI